MIDWIRFDSINLLLRWSSNDEDDISKRRAHGQNDEFFVYKIEFANFEPSESGGDLLLIYKLICLAERGSSRCL